MNPDPASLENLRDLALPPAVPWWPLAPGWYVLFALFLVAATVFSFRAWRSWRANAYRRAALKELSAAPDLATVAEILKRTALAANPRSEVASLSGDAWITWLATRGPDFPQPAHTILLQVYKDPNTPAPPHFIQATENWIQHHSLTLNPEP